MKDVILNSEVEEDAVWKKIEDDLSNDEVLDYQVVIPNGGKQIVLNIDVDLGGGFEGGYASTSLSSILSNKNSFRFAIHKEDFIDEIGKFFGMQDVKTGYPDFDKKIIVKTNQEELVKEIFSDEKVRKVILSLNDFSFGIHTHHVSGSKEPFLELIIDDAITNIIKIKEMYRAFYQVLTSIEGIRSERLPV